MGWHHEYVGHNSTPKVGSNLHVIVLKDATRVRSSKVYFIFRLQACFPPLTPSLHIFPPTFDIPRQ